ncbi:aminoglycoside phosphotransferase family protein [Streptomyces sp. Edi2]|uniref:aminoglycoside phosphotransferase family protein n=1 Tax=Streptomyces sp. Edi2 TaxID=3162528 RepID=UPI0033060FC9
MHDGSGREVPLSGGRITNGVVRVGDTVRRPVSRASDFVARLLSHLEDCGFDGAPRYLGVDDTGRDMLSYVPGHVPSKFQKWTDAQVAAAGVLLRSLHEATRGSSLAGPCPVVCHHDPGPNNTVFRDGRPVAFIDFDMAAPGDPLEDVGYASWTWCIASKSAAPPVTEQAQQVRMLADGYELTDLERRGLVDVILERQIRNVQFWLKRDPGPSELHPSEDVIAARVEWSCREHAFVSTYRSTFEQALR